MRHEPTIKITPVIIKAIKGVVTAVLKYEKLSQRAPDITGEVGEVLVSHKLKLSLLKNR